MKRCDKICVWLLVTTMSSLYGNELTYSRACSKGACGDWGQAQTLMSELMIDNPDSPELVYDNGIAAYRLKEFEKAAAYFKQAAQLARSAAMKVQSLFNAGNAAVNLKLYDDAIKSYESVLRIDPNNVPAKHNLEVVKKMRQEQENKQQQNGGNDDQSKQQQNQDGNGDDQQKKSSKSKQDESRDKGNDSEQKSGADDKSQKRDEQHGSDSGQQDQEHNAQDNQDGEQERQSKKRSSERKDNKGEQDDDDRHENPQQKGKHSQSPNDTEDTKKEQMQSGTQKAASQRAKEEKSFKQQFAPSEQWMLNALERREQSDEKVQKQLMKQEVDKQLPGKHGQNNW